MAEYGVPVALDWREPDIQKEFTRQNEMEPCDLYRPYWLSVNFFIQEDSWVMHLRKRWLGHGFGVDCVFRDGHGLRNNLYLFTNLFII